MKHYLHILTFLVLLFSSCEENEIATPLVMNSKLVVNWDPPFYGNSSWKDNAMIHLYSSDSEFENPAGNAEYSLSLSNIYPENGGVITNVNSVTFSDLEPKKYWVTIFMLITIKDWLSTTMMGQSPLKIHYLPTPQPPSKSIRKG